MIIFLLKMVCYFALLVSLTVSPILTVLIDDDEFSMILCLLCAFVIVVSGAGLLLVNALGHVLEKGKQERVNRLPKYYAQILAVDYRPITTGEDGVVYYKLKYFITFPALHNTIQIDAPSKYHGVLCEGDTIIVGWDGTNKPVFDAIENNIAIRECFESL